MTIDYYTSLFACNNMAFEIDFLPVGTGSKSGDAIALRYWNHNVPNAKKTVVTIDGGTQDSGDALANHIRGHYNTTTVDLAILTHPDMDHASGMLHFLKQVKFNALVMHLPWKHNGAVAKLIDDDRTTLNSLARRAQENLTAAKAIEKLAIDRGIGIVEPFTGRNHENVITVLGPTELYYQDRLANFNFMPGTSKTATNQVAEAGGSTEIESWEFEALKEPPEDASSARNNSSAILLFQYDGQKIMFTGDAGVPALNGALDYLDRRLISYNDLMLFQIPHHGSRKNLGPALIRRLFGPIRPKGTPTWTAVASVAPEGLPKHPNKKVTNALTRRGAHVAVTAGQSLCFYNEWIPRLNYGPIASVPLYSVVDSDSATE